MQQPLHNSSILRVLTALSAVLGFLLLAGCPDTTTAPVDTYLVKVGSSTLSVSEFNEVFEISKTAYSHSDMLDPGVVADIKQRLLNQMIEELILIEKAGELGISISDAELDYEVRKIKADYPDDIFEEMLLEVAVSFEAWKKRLKTQLIAQRFIQAELASKVTITSQEVARYYAEHFPEDSEGNAADRSRAKDDEMVLRMLKNQKVQTAYANWMEVNRQSVSIDINARLWEEITRKNS